MTESTNESAACPHCGHQIDALGDRIEAGQASQYVVLRRVVVFHTAWLTALVVFFGTLQLLL